MSNVSIDLSEQQAYEAYLEKMAEREESLCQRCGACCGALDKDPCVHLVREVDGRFACATYANRHGLQRTISGREFNCVPVRKVLFESWAGAWQCGYKKLVNY